ncbi:MAG: hypothetical protein IPH37_16700 [Burkholderiales bacterium]|nr:hypothetical protein [Burkholderiales bacterium]
MDATASMSVSESVSTAHTSASCMSRSTCTASCPGCSGCSCDVPKSKARRANARRLKYSAARRELSRSAAASPSKRSLICSSRISAAALRLS